jgi:hypothetical protein
VGHDFALDQYCIKSLASLDIREQILGERRLSGKLASNGQCLQVANTVEKLP